MMRLLAKMMVRNECATYGETTVREPSLCEEPHTLRGGIGAQRQREVRGAESGWALTYGATFASRPETPPCRSRKSGPCGRVRRPVWRGGLGLV